MVLAKSSDFDPELIQDLKDELDDKREICSDILLTLEESPEDLALVRKLFREVHTIKGDISIMGLSQYVPLLQSIEDIIDLLRNSKIVHTPAIGDVLLLTLDRTYKELNAFIRGDDPFDQDAYNHLAEMVARVAKLSDEEQRQQTLAVIQTLAPETIPDEEEEEARQIDHYFTKEEINEEVAFFLQLSLLLDHRSPYGEGRTERMFELALTMNHMAGNPIDTDQLQAALYLHDLGMGFVPQGMMRKASSLSTHDWKWVKNHVNVVYQILSPFEVWSEAAEIILQHHERLDGSGYPGGLIEPEICEGAKLLAIVDSFEAITQKRAYQNEQQRPIVRAITEINQCAGKLFCPVWVGHFNRAVRQLHIKKQKKATK